MVRAHRIKSRLRCRFLRRRKKVSYARFSRVIHVIFSQERLDNSKRNPNLTTPDTATLR